MKKKSEKKIEKINVIEGLSISRIFNYSDDCTFFNMHIDAPIGKITIYSCKVISSKKGDFISFPARKGEDDTFYNHVFFKIDDDLKEKIIDAISDNI